MLVSIVIIVPDGGPLYATRCDGSGGFTSDNNFTAFTQIKHQQNQM